MARAPLAVPIRFDHSHDRVAAARLGHVVQSFDSRHDPTPNTLSRAHMEDCTLCRVSEDLSALTQHLGVLKLPLLVREQGAVEEALAACAPQLVIQAMRRHRGESGLQRDGCSLLAGLASA